MKDFPVTSPLGLQIALVKELTSLFDGMRFQNAADNGESLTKLAIYEQSLPIATKEVKAYEDETTDTTDFYTDEVEDSIIKCPWCNVKIDKWWQDKDNRWIVKVAFIFGIYNNDKSNCGHREIINLVEKIRQRFTLDPMLESQYRNRGNFDAEVNEEDTYPYFFGVVVTDFELKGVEREWEKYL